MLARQGPAQRVRRGATAGAATPRAQLWRDASGDAASAVAACETLVRIAEGR